MSASSKEPIKVAFQPEGRAVYVLPGTALLEAAGRAGIVIETPCGGRGTCGKCRVEITRGAPAPNDSERAHLSAAEIERGARLACQAHVAAEMVVEVPVAARFFEHKILTDGTGRPVPLHPTVTKHHLLLPEATLADQRSDEDRLLETLAEHKARPGPAVQRELPGLLRETRGDLTAAVAEGRIVAIEPGDTVAQNFGMAFDIGTTTVVGFLLDLFTGREVAVASRANPQIPFGDDVVSRIQHAAQPDGLRRLQEVIVGGLNEIISECCQKSGVGPERLYEATVVGNTTMSHLFLGISPEFVAQAPYVAAVRRAVNLSAREVGLRIHPHGVVHVLPNVAGFVGSDTVAVVLATGMHESDDLQLAIDIGTNGEIVIGNKNRLLCCSTAAGPAFEGARIRFGMRAADGAIDKIVINGDVEYNVIANVPPRGLCGTALIDLAAELLRLGIIDETGRILSGDDLPAALPDALKRRVVAGERGAEFVIAPAEKTQINGPIVLTQRDVRELQLAKGAIATGAAILIKEFGVEAKDLKHILLAGAFGNFIRRKPARRIGLLPDVPGERILYIGNAAGAGARMALLSRHCKHEADVISERMQYLELAGRADFQEAFAEAMMFSPA